MTNIRLPLAVSTSLTQTRQPSAAYRGQKLGAMAVREAEKWIAECGYKQIVIDSRIEAVGFYEKLGYKSAGEKTHQSGVFECTRMKKSL